jgi:nudix-type nucleoside diphosphatase (YffH/AdpP family)
MRNVQIESKRRIFDDFFRIEETILRYERFDGQMSNTVRRLNFERGDSVAAIILNRETQRVLFVNQFKYPTYEKGPGWISETVAGVLEVDEDPEEAIQREILEETGYKARKLTHIATFYVSPGGSSERIILYYAEVDSTDKVSSGGGLASEGEDIQIVELSLPELWTALDSGELVDAKTIIAAMWLRRRLEEGK